jgi:CheY-like chemotaxis protein
VTAVVWRLNRDGRRSHRDRNSSRRDFGFDHPAILHTVYDNSVHLDRQDDNIAVPCGAHPSMGETENRRKTPGPDRRRFPRGGRRDGDLPGRHPTVAIVERYDGVRRPCARYLEHFNFEVAEAADAESALTLLESVRPALILIEDVESAGFDRLQQAAQAHSIPFVSIATAFAESPGADSEQADGVLMKPFTLGTMLDEVRRVLRARMVAAAGP